ncbi:MAG: hypothetical protein ACREBE_02695, partial [bacterium]
MLPDRARIRSLLLAAGTVLLAIPLSTCTEPSADTPAASSADSPASSVESPASTAGAVHDGLSQSSTFTTLFKAPVGVEGLTADRGGNLFTGGRGGAATCPIGRIPSTRPAPPGEA